MLPQLQPSVFALHAFDPEPVLTHEAADRADRAQVRARRLARATRAAAQEIPRSPSGQLYRARSRLYRSQGLQVNMCLKALAEIYTMHSFAQL